MIQLEKMIVNLTILHNDNKNYIYVDCNNFITYATQQLLSSNSSYLIGA